MKPSFNSSDWLPSSDLQGTPSPQPSETDKAAAVERALEALEQASADITAGYANWRDLGFAFAHEFGAQGRDYFHRVSRMNSDYDPKACDQQYDRCLKSGGTGITLGTFFHHVKEAGIRLPQLPAEGDYPPLEVPLRDRPHNPELPVVWMNGRNGQRRLADEDEAEPVPLPSIPQQVYDNLPPFLGKAVGHTACPEERDQLLLGSLVTLSVAVPNMYGYYGGRRVYPNLYLFITAPASAGKGDLGLCKHLVNPIHAAKREEFRLLQEAYEQELQQYNAAKDKGDKPLKPAEKMLFIPANNSTSGIFQLLYDNDCRGLLFETEADSLTSSFSSDFGNYSDGFRKAFHHETISYYRKTDREYVHLNEPLLSTVLSGTPRQVSALIPDAENGLFGRFLFYHYNLKPEWKDVFKRYGLRGTEALYKELGEEYHVFYRELQSQPPMRLSFSREQQLQFNQRFSRLQFKYLALSPGEYLASVRRLGLICFRMAMIFTALRYKEDGLWSKVRQCDSRDFDNIMILAQVLVEHSNYLFQQLPLKPHPILRDNSKKQLFENLPESFSRMSYLSLAAELKIPSSTADKIIKRFIKYGLVTRERKGEYVVADKREGKV